MQENLSRAKGPALGGAWFVLWAVALGAALWLAGGRVRGLLTTTASVAVPAATLSIALALPVAVLVAKRPGRFAWLLLVGVGSLAITPLHAVAAGWLASLGGQGVLPRLFGQAGPTTGWLSGVAGAVWVQAAAATPLAALLTVAALRSVDPRREEQALLEAPAGRVLWRVTLRESARTIVAAGVLIATLVAAEIAVTDLMRVRTFAEEVYTQVATGELLGIGDSRDAVGRMAAGVVTLALVAAAALATLTRRVRLTWDSAAMGRGLRLRGANALGWTVAACVAVALVSVVPIASLVHQAGVTIEPTEGFPRRVWNAGALAANLAATPIDQRRELGVSLALGVGVATISTVAAIAMAWSARGRRAWSAALVVGAAAAFATPGPVWALAAIRVLNQPTDAVLALLGELYDSWLTVALVQAGRITPLLLMVVWPAVAGTPADALDAARADGAGPMTRFWRVAAVWRSPIAAAAWLIAFALSVGELSATALLAPPGTPPVSVRLLTLLHYGVEDRVASLCLVLMAGCFAVAVAAAAIAARARPPAPGANPR